jgi:hypothetical protein
LVVVLYWEESKTVRVKFSPMYVVL